MKFIPTTIIFILGVICFFLFKTTLHLNSWFLIIWVLLFLVIQFFGAYLIQLNFHFTSINELSKNEIQKTVLLSFDDGPHNPNTTRVLEVLKKHNVKALFCIIGKQVAGNESIMQHIINDGHLIANHSLSHHYFFDVWSTQKVTNDLIQCQEIVKHYQPNGSLFRPPYGVTNPNIASAVKQLQLQSVGWNIRSYDTKIKDIEKINQRILSKLKPGAIILLHDRLDFMPDLLEKLIPAIKQKEYVFTIAI